MITPPQVMEIIDKCGYFVYSSKQINKWLSCAEEMEAGSGRMNPRPEYSRRIYKTKNRVIKIFNSTYLFRNNIIGGILSGLYNNKTTPALTGVFFNSSGDCGGYVMELCLVNMNHADYMKMVSPLCESTNNSNYVFTDFIRPNIGKTYGGKLTLLDLESCEPLSPSSSAQCKQLSYMQYVEMLCFQKNWS